MKILFLRLSRRCKSLLQRNALVFLVLCVSFLVAIGVSAWQAFSKDGLNSAAVAIHGIGSEDPMIKRATSPSPSLLERNLQETFSSKLSDDILRLDAQGSESLLALVEKGIQSAEPRDWAVAKMILDRCVLSIQNLGGIDRPQPISLRPGDVGLFEEARDKLRKRCEGLLRIRLDDVLRYQRIWTESLRKAEAMPNDENLFVAGGGANLLTKSTQKRLRDLVVSAGPEALVWAPEALAEVVAHQSEGGVFSPESPLSKMTTLWAGFELARCDLGFECGPSSLRLLSMCIGAGVCGSDVRTAVIGALLSDSDRATAKAQASLIANAITSRTTSSLGLDVEQLRSEKPEQAKQ